METLAGFEEQLLLKKEK